VELETSERWRDVGGGSIARDRRYDAPPYTLGARNDGYRRVITPR
jgi:hypothetical protein